MIFEHWKQPNPCYSTFDWILLGSDFRSIAKTQGPKTRHQWISTESGGATPNEFVVFLGGGDKNWVVVSNIFYFHPYLGKWSNLTNIFQMGWNHQLEKVATHLQPKLEFDSSHTLRFRTRTIKKTDGRWKATIPRV